MAIWDLLKKNTCSDTPTEKTKQLRTDAKEAILEQSCIKNDMTAEPPQPDEDEENDLVGKYKKAESDNSSRSAFHTQCDGSVSVQEQADTPEQSTAASDDPVAMEGADKTCGKSMSSNAENTETSETHSEFVKLSNLPQLGENTDSWSEVAG